MSTFSTVDAALKDIIEASNTYIAAIVSVVAVYLVYRLIKRKTEK